MPLMKYEEVVRMLASKSIDRFFWGKLEMSTRFHVTQVSIYSHFLPRTGLQIRTRVCLPQAFFVFFFHPGEFETKDQEKKGHIFYSNNKIFNQTVYYLMKV